MATSLKRARSPRTVLLRMAADADRAQRLKAIKAERPDLTWPQIAEAAGVTERSVAAWAATGSMSYENAKKVAAFLDIDLQWLWRGPATQTPDLLGVLGQPDVRDQLDRIEAMLRELVGDAFLQQLEGALREEREQDDGPSRAATG